MEVVAMDMKLRGMYIARQLSFKGVTFEIQEIPFQDDFEKVYDDSVVLVRCIFLSFSIVFNVSMRMNFFLIENIYK